MAEPRGTLVIMAKAPVAGSVKTRLARAVGPIEALRFYRAATARLIRRVGRDRRWRTVLAATPDHMAGAPFWPGDLERRAQGGGDLGARMQRMVDFAPAGPVVIVGSDIPAIARAHVAAAFRALKSHEVVFGPAEDGGYWLVGLRRPPRAQSIFGDVRWSSRHALADTLANVRGRPAFLERLSDVDDEAAFRAWRRKALW
jgi:rSAM/selenodomain-associated transferase 1